MVFYYLLANTFKHSDYLYKNFFENYMIIEAISNMIFKLADYYILICDSAYQSSSIPSWPLIIYLICSTMCLIFSVFHHWFQALDEKTNYITLKMDIIGIFILFFAASFLPIYYLYYCDTFFISIYVSLNFLIITLVLIYFFTTDLNSNGPFRIFSGTFVAIISGMPILNFIFFP